ncbi:DNA-dependent protein kinase catalytic subunit [Caerostris extrusa]|uniref:DNA-dependent protein kinase catalytic subunit n=1 Tax=Caerostris extrusa TaxID=172846 RepID=A0AAV4MDL6_CAEEX|nr:DNA-dependent protein kinase catalytic subunit [Caerostris extrusa]
MSDIIELVRKHLETLKTFLDNKKFSDNEGTVSDIIKSIRDNYSNYSLKTQDREILNAHLLNNENGILGFLRSILLLKERMIPSMDMMRIYRHAWKFFDSTTVADIFMLFRCLKSSVTKCFG